jgi:hypothetical protein
MELSASGRKVAGELPTSHPVERFLEIPGMANSSLECRPGLKPFGKFTVYMDTVLR